MEKIGKYKKWILALIFSVILIVVYKTFDNFSKIMGFIGLVWKSLSPFVVGFVIAYILNMPCRKINTKLSGSKKKFISKNSKAISIILVYLISLLALFVIIRSIVPALYKNIVDLYYNIPRYFDEAISAVVKWQSENNITIFEVDEMTATNTFNNILSKIDITEFSKYAKGVINITSSVINLFIGIIVSVYMLIDKERIIETSKHLTRILLKKETSEKIIKVVAKVNEIFSKYIFCLLLDALFMAVVSTIVLSLIKVKYALILGLMIGICNLIPYFGAIISGVSSVLITLLTGGILKAIWAAIGLGLLQQIDGNFVGPKIMGQMLNVSPLWIIFAVTLGGGLFGVGGMIISVPLLMVIKMIASEAIKNKEAEMNEISKLGDNDNE